ncbi:hypothetical protein F6T93_001499 [Enterobacter hormaechei]|nr:hypothetical protein [Enterobacter hormaechei]
MADIVRVGLLARWQGALPYGTLIEQGVLATSVCLLLLWGGVLVLTLRRSPHPRALLQTWCRNWLMPFVLIGVGLLLIANGSHHGVGRWLDGADMWAVRFMMDSRSVPTPVTPGLTSSGTLAAEATLLRCPGTYAGLEVLGCKP